MDTSSITPDVAIEEKALKTLLDAFGSAFSLQDIASAFCKAGRDPDLAGHILSGAQTSPLTDKKPVSESNGNIETRNANGNGVKAPMWKRKPVSMGTVSSVIGKNYVWRVAKSNGNGNPNGTKPLKVDASEFVSSTDHSLGSKNVDSSTSVESSFARDSDLNDDVENFLFEMLGKGFQLERSAIHDVLGRCGYDMKKSLETLFDLSAANLDKKYETRKATNSHSKSESFSTQNQARKPNGRYEQEKEVLTSLFHAPERHESYLSTNIVKLSRRSRARKSVIAEPLEDLSIEHADITTKPYLANINDDDDNPYQILRKAVKEHRETMKAYYRAATEAFASGDRARAMVLVEKGKFFGNKAREADAESASKIFEIRGRDSETEDDMSLDLQDHEAKEAIKLVKDHLRNLGGISSLKHLKVVTGKDGRDAQRRNRLVKKLLERDSIKWTEDEVSGTILIGLAEIDPESLSFGKK